MTAKFLEATNLKAGANIRHGFFTSAGGVSGGHYTSLNCGYGSNDDPANVKENRRRVAEALEGDEANLFTPHQVHSATAVIATEPWDRTKAPEADAIVTNVPGLRVGILSADCCPILFADISAGVVGAAHAGWRGAFSGVMDDVLDKMESLGAKRENVIAAIGPTISQRAYEIGPEFEDNFLQASPENADFFSQSPSGRSHFDLSRYVRSRLEEAGIHEKNVELLNICTFSNESVLYSYRRSIRSNHPDYGRQISAIGLK